MGKKKNKKKSGAEPSPGSPSKSPKKSPSKGETVEKTVEKQEEISSKDQPKSQDGELVNKECDVGIIEDTPEKELKSDSVDGDISEEVPKPEKPLEKDQNYQKSQKSDFLDGDDGGIIEDKLKSPALDPEGCNSKPSCQDESHLSESEPEPALLGFEADQKHQKNQIPHETEGDRDTKNTCQDSYVSGDKSPNNLSNDDQDSDPLHIPTKYSPIPIPLPPESPLALESESPIKFMDTGDEAESLDSPVHEKNNSNNRENLNVENILEPPLVESEGEWDGEDLVDKAEVKRLGKSGQKSEKPVKTVKNDTNELESKTLEAERPFSRQPSLVYQDGDGSVHCDQVFSDDDINDYLLDENESAEARLAARRQARAEARDIRMKELEKQQKESDDNADRHYDMYSSGAPPTDVVNRAAFRVALGSHRSTGHSVGSASYHSSRRSSEDSTEDGVINMRDLRHELKELEDKFRKSMVQNAQLDNEKSALTYQVELLKDKIEDLEESLSLLQREHRDKCRDFENLKRLSNQIKDELEYYKSQLQERDELIKEYGLVLVENEVEVDLGNGEKGMTIKRALVTQQTAQVLSTLGHGSLDVRLKKVLEEKNELLDEIRRLKLDLEEEKGKNVKGGAGGTSNNVSSGSNHLANGPESEGETSKQMADYKFKTQKYEQEIVALQANVSRLDTQVQRFKTVAEEAESREDDLKVEKRKLQRELREAQSKLDELETTNSHLQKRLDKLKTAKSTLLKEL